MNAPSPRTQVRRLPRRASYDREVVNAILDQGLVCHVGFQIDGQPYVIPMAYARIGEELILHGSSASRLLTRGAGGVSFCATVTLLDGLVFARSGFHHSMNYRSAVILGVAREVVDPEEKRRALDAIVDHAAPGRSSVARPANDQELKATKVLALPIQEFSAKIRTGGPIDDEEDFGVECWAGEIPLRLSAAEPIADTRAPVAGSPPQLKRLDTHDAIGGPIGDV